jgi:hypothetical protein
MDNKSLPTNMRNLSYHTRNALLKGVIIAVITAVVYLAVIVITTPNLPPIIAINAALKVNGIIIIGLSIGVGIQLFTSTYSKGLGCRLDDKIKYDQKQQRHKHKDIRHMFRIGGRTGSSGGSTAISSFLSFFSLVPLGCCGSWLFILSMLPSVFGSTISVILIEYSKLLSYVGLAIVLGFSALSVLHLRKELNGRRMLESRNLNFSNLKTTETLESEPGRARARRLD